MEGYEQNDGMDTNDRDEIYSNAVKAGKRTYFFDVKATRNNDYYLTITESKKKKFPDTHIGKNKAMKERGISCAATTDRQERANYKPIEIKKTE